MQYGDVYRETKYFSSLEGGFSEAAKIASQIWCIATGNESVRDVSDEFVEDAYGKRLYKRLDTKRNTNFASLYPNIPDFSDILAQAPSKENPEKSNVSLSAEKKIQRQRETEKAFILLRYQPIGTYTNAVLPDWACDPEIAKERLVPVSCAVLTRQLPTYKAHAGITTSNNMWYVGRVATLPQYGGQKNAQCLWDAILHEVFVNRNAEQLVFTRRAYEKTKDGQIYYHGHTDRLADWYTNRFCPPTLVPVPDVVDPKTNKVLETKYFTEAVYTYSAEAYFEKLQERVAAAQNIRSMVAMAR